MHALVALATTAMVVCMATLGCTTGAPTHAPVVALPPSAALFDQAWSWTDEQGASVALEQYRGAPIVLTAFFTSCTVRCPLTVEKLRGVDEAFRRRHIPVRVVLVTLDPHNDTPERLQRFKESHHLPSEWHLLQGSDIDTRALSRYLNVRTIFEDTHIDHDVRIAVFDSNGHRTKSFADWGFDTDALVGTANWRSSRVEVATLSADLYCRTTPQWVDRPFD